MTLDLSQDLERLIQTRVESGQYRSATEVVSDALRLLEQRDELLTHRSEKIRAQIEEGWQSAQGGDFVDGDTVFDRLDAEMESAEHPVRK